MLAGMRSRFLLSFLWTLSVAACGPVQAQINGVPPSVTSIGFGGRFLNGIPPSVTSLGTNGYGSLPFLGGCCASFFLPTNSSTPLFSDHQHRRRDKDKDKDKVIFPVEVIEPIYAPYADSPTDEAGDDPPDVGHARAADPPIAESPGKRVGNSDSVTNASDVYPAEEPVAAQPSTLLVFRDGHRFEIVNYAVVGDVLFDFASDRTRKILLADLDLPATQKANDDRGVDFEIPAGATR
jgi:hypothetical protein